MSKQPFKSDYDEGSRTTLPSSAEATPVTPSRDRRPIHSLEATQTSGVVSSRSNGSQTPSVGKPWGANKPRRVIVRGKISK